MARYMSVVLSLSAVSCRAGLLDDELSVAGNGASSEAAQGSEGPPTHIASEGFPDLSNYEIRSADFFLDGGTTIVHFENASGKSYCAGLECPMDWSTKPPSYKDSPLHVWVARDVVGFDEYRTVAIGGPAEQAFLDTLQRWLDAHAVLVDRVRKRRQWQGLRDTEYTAAIVLGIVKKLEARNTRE